MAIYGTIATSMDERFLKAYNPVEVEDSVYKRWEDSGLFNPDVCVEKGITKADAPTFCIVLPPPNVTGTLHMGHAAMLATEDILVRYHRMMGDRTLWLPGTDSAALATQSKVEEQIYKKEKLTRHDLGREELLHRIDAFATDSQNTILNQVRKMGSSLDWSRLAFTLDAPRTRAVLTAFVRLYNLGLVYRGFRSVNWDPKMQTTVSDDEVERVEQSDPFYYFQYGPFVIGTVRPETKFGDKYVVMHPDDTRYSAYRHGQTIELEWINGPITATIIKDTAADMEVGTGVMTITPWHSAVDFEIAKRHNLDKEQIIDERGLLLPIAGEFAGMHIKKARPLILEKLKNKGLLVRTDESYVHSIATNSRGGGTIEPQIKQQWFIDVNKPFVLEESTLSSVPAGSTVTLKELMRTTVESGDTQILPDHFEKIYYHWIDNLHDWCISRQIWYGHQIPVWYRGDETFVGVDAPEGEGWTQDHDTLDTWFSSGLWTFSTLGWPDETPDLLAYHPTTVLETGYDILFFWIARMILMSTALMGEKPFSYAYLHGLVRDDKGRKMSKSLGNIIDPLDLIPKYGADAARLSLIVGAAAGNDMKLSEEKVKGYKHFANKIWNITRFVLENYKSPTGRGKTYDEDTALEAELNELATNITADLNAFRLYLAGEKIYHYTWHRFADVILEESKVIFRADDTVRSEARARTLYTMLVTQLKILHPFMPFITEEIWSALPEKDSDLLLVAPWPTA